MDGLIETDERVSLHYALWLESTEPFESTYDGDPEQFRFGRGEFPEFLEKKIVNMVSGQEIEFTLAAAEYAFGAYDPDNKQLISTDEFEMLDCSVGALVEFDLPNGDTVHGLIEKIEDTGVLVDFNNPLIGRDVHCRVTIIETDK